MKYIRTKYDVELNDEKIEREITAQADTIEELCDEFVIVFPTNYKKVYKTFSRCKDHYFKCPIENGGYKLFGAIWTDKGLIYVAKMNKRGQLELL